MMRFAVLVFPGTWSDHDCHYALREVLGQEADLVWHKEATLPSDTRAVLLPGGFSYGDYLRGGAMARFSPIMTDVRRFADAGGLVLGVCNGFQVLCEAGLLPGALLRNRDLHFVCETVHVRVERTDTPFTSGARAGDVLRIPIKHGEGAYFAAPALLEELERKRQIVLRYCRADGTTGADANPNGSAANIAGVVNERANVLGLMPHPEHAVERLLAGADGRVILGSLIDAAGAGAAA